MPQVIIVSNRLPVSVKKMNGKLSFSPSVGGLATGLSSYVNNKNNTWIGWPGIASDELTEADKTEIITELAKHNCSPVFLKQKQVDDFYNGFSNTVLWPLFHELRAQDRPGERRERWFRAYRSVNRLFAETVEVVAGKGATIWVHDYQLLLVPEMLRKQIDDATIGFFLHIPFPNSQKFNGLSLGKQLLKGVLGADVIGFHTPDYVRNFLDSCTTNGTKLNGGNEVLVNGRAVRVMSFPMGIDYKKYESSGKSRIVKQALKRYQKRYKGMKVIVAVDRLDPSKGLLERLQAYKTFLERHSEQHGKVVFVMVASPSRTDIPAYKRLGKRLTALVDEINATYGTQAWQPVDYMNITIPFEEVTALFQVADVAFIAPIRDGMNLAAKEFVASTHRNSVLILSETAGASQELHDALIVNPHRSETVVRALYDSLTMNRSELRGRLKRMKRHLKNNTVQTWAKTFVDTLNTTIAASQKMTPTAPLKYDEIMSKYKSAKRRLLLLDYDGTLMPFHANPAKVVPSKNLIKVLRELGERQQNDVVIMSGRSASDLEKWFGKLPVDLVAEHGASVKLAGRKAWRTYEKADMRWREILLPILEKHAAKTPGAHIEAKKYTLVWHFRGVEPYYAQKTNVIIKRTLKKFLKEHGLIMQKGNKVFEFKHPSITKGGATRRLLTRKPDFFLAIGDDVTDESMFKEVPSGGFGVKVGRGITAAQYRVADHKAVHELLERLAKQK